MNVIAIIQARMGSTRLPGKVLADLNGMPMLAMLLQRVRVTRGLDGLVVATTTQAEDDQLADWLVQEGVDCFRGDENDVLSRFYQAASSRAADIIVRVTADDPLKDPEIIARGIDLLCADPLLDYCSNTLEPTFPEGLDIEVFRFSALEDAYLNAAKASEREHVTPYIWKHPDRFRLHNFKMSPDLSAWRWTVDKPADLTFIREICANFPDQPLVSYREVIAFIERHPELMKINSDTVRNEGYLKSIRMENI